MCKLHYAFCVQSKELLERVQTVKSLKDTNIEKITCVDDIIHFLHSFPTVGVSSGVLIHLYEKSLRYKFLTNFFWGLYYAKTEEVGDFEALITEVFSVSERSLLRSLIDFKKSDSLFIGVFSMFIPKPVS